LLQAHASQLPAYPPVWLLQVALALHIPEVRYPPAEI
jgi:hypothetical protein